MFPWQREETCDEASGCVHHENAPVLIDFNEKSLEPVKSWYFLALNRAPSRPPGRSHPVPPPCPALGLRNTPSQAQSWGDTAFQGMLRAGRQPHREGENTFSIIQSHFPDCRNHKCPLYIQSKQGCCFGAVPTRERVELLCIVLPLKRNVELLNFHSTKEAGA